jgi:hypothetical protein
MRSSFVPCVFATVLSILATVPALAQSIILRPAVVSLAGRHGESVTQVLTLQNESDIPLDFVMEAKDVVVRDGARVFLEAGVLADSIAATAVFTPSSLRVPARSSGSVTATLTLPAAMQHRAVAAYFRGATTIHTGNRRATMSIGTLFTFTVSDRISVAAGGLEATPPSAARNAQLKSRLVNDGTEPVVPAGMAVILNDKGQLVGKLAFKTQRLLPGEAATLVADYAGDLPPGAYRAVATFDIAGQPLTLTSPLVVP